MPHNPFGNDLFLPVLVRVVLLIVAGLAGVVLAQRRPLRVLRRSTFFSRTRTWFWMAPLFLVCVFTGGFVAFLLATFVLVQGLSEFARIAGIDRRYALLLMLWSQVGLLVAALAREYFLFLPFGFLILLTLVPIVSGEIAEARAQVGSTLFGYTYIALPLAYIVFAKAAQPWGLNFLVIVTVAVAFSDVAAYAVGVAVGVALLANAIPDEWTAAGVVVLVLMIAVGSVWGDVTESLVKRAFQVERASTVLFGFGGILDRVDSLLMALPLCYYSLILVNNLAS